MSIKKLNSEVIACDRCPRLRSYCEDVARKKKKSHQDEEYWGKPIPSFGDPHARVLIVGLAPAAHGANRTGRMFTGDESGRWLYRALEKAGFANEAGANQDPKTANRNDGLQLKDVLITAVAHCAPPDNKPLPEEIKNCSEYLHRELEELKDLRGFVALGQIALRGLWSVLPEEWKSSKALPSFSHGAKVELKNGLWIICSYHPSQQNTFTKRLTEPMFDQIFKTVRNLLY